MPLYLGLCQQLQLADYNNERLGVTQAQRLAMETGSMHGWDVPGADPTVYAQPPSVPEEIAASSYGEISRRDGEPVQTMDEQAARENKR